MLHAVDHYRSIEASYVHRFLATSDNKAGQLTVAIVREPGAGAAATLSRADGGVVEFVTDGKQMIEHDVGTLHVSLVLLNTTMNSLPHQ